MPATPFSTAARITLTPASASTMSVSPPAWWNMISGNRTSLVVRHERRMARRRPSAERSPEGLAAVGVGERRQGLWPHAGLDLAALVHRPHAAVPADLLHVVVQLHHVPV